LDSPKFIGFVATQKARAGTGPKACIPSRLCHRLMTDFEQHNDSIFEFADIQFRDDSIIYLGCLVQVLLEDFVAVRQ